MQVDEKFHNLLVDGQKKRAYNPVVHGRKSITIFYLDDKCKKKRRRGRGYAS
jgi:hypothetical protein